MIIILIFVKYINTVNLVKIIIKILPILILSAFFVSCNKDQASKKSDTIENEKKMIAADISHLKVDIKGMTCEIGCARLIQSKLYKADGISYAKISFADSSGLISFDKNRISQNEVKEIIQNTAGGDIYKVAGIHEIQDAKKPLDGQ